MKRFLIFISAFIFGIFLATNAFCQPVQEIDPRSIWRDGSKATTAVIPFAFGLSVPDSKFIYFGDVNTVAGAIGGYLYFAAGGSTYTNISFEAADVSSSIRFSTPSGETYYDTSGITHRTNTGFTITDFVMGDNTTFVSDPWPTPFSRFYRDLYVQPPVGGNTTTLFRIRDASSNNIFNVDVSTPAITNSAKTNIAVTNANAFLVENGSGTDRFLVDTNTPKIDLLANTNLGASGTGYDFTAWSATASKALRWQPNASSSNPVLLFDILSGRGKQIEISGTDTIIGSANTYVNVDVTNQWTGAQNIAALFQFYYRDKRTITSSSAEFKRILDFYFERGASSSFTSNQTTHTVEVAQFTLTDAGTYSRAAGITNELTGMNFTYNNILPVIQATSGSGTYNFTTLLIDGTISGNGNGFTTSTQTAFDWQPVYQQFPGFIGFLSATQIGMYLRPTNNVAGGTASAMYGVRYAPTISGTTPATEYALHAARSGIGLIADGSSSDVTTAGGAGGGLIMGASSDWKRYYEADNEAVEDIPTGAVYDFRINSVDQMSLGLRSLTLGDNTANDFNIAFDQTNDASLKWDSADEAIYIRTNGAPEYLYPTYAAGVSITTYGESSPAARYALQAWGIPSAAFGTIGGFWGGFSENGSSTGYGGTEVYGGTFYNYFTGTNSRTITSIVGNYIGNEFNVVSAITTSNLRGIYLGVAEGTGSLTTATTITGMEIAAPTVTFTGATPTTYYGLRLAAYTGATTNYSAFINGAGILGFRNANHTISSPSSGILRVAANTTVNLYAGGVASGFDIATFSTTAITVTDAINFVLGTTTGSKFGTATSQKISFWNATPIVQPVNSVAINDVLVNTGLRASGGTSNFTSAISTNGDITSSDTGDLGWAVVDGTDNTACTSQCTSAAVFGLNLAAGATAPVIVGPADTAADICLCAGSS